ncbi:hypothetical protein [Nitrospirillum viridazoti]|uniref:Uncharacterized protein n=1 Tax=Nitrospirillum viridazoti CBAmc TaxID=1441467 RepID=A0A248JSD1_9PROT|nr:hypothetical protein [Nitrospirillum amazonense]ASG21391.1 hypothetical protein Y958_11550 [Nitrospirillum amazonense CBAmc]TWB33068.1 hypothetical protein FBZ91_115130 [Nitrospirillum amazonense]
MSRGPRPPRSNLAFAASSRRPVDEVKRAGWRETGTLAVSVHDARLNDFERQFLVNVGVKLYGASPAVKRSNASSPDDLAGV